MVIRINVSSTNTTHIPRVYMTGGYIRSLDKSHLILADYRHSLEILVHMYWVKQTDGITGIFGESYSRMEFRN